MQSYRDLIVWQKSMSVVKLVYNLTKRFPKEEMFGLVCQIRRSAVSVPSNIAEGYGRNSTDDYIRFLRIACGSLYEIQTQLEISFDLGYIAEDAFKGLLEKSNEIGRMLSGLINKLNSGKNSQ